LTIECGQREKRQSLRFCHNDNSDNSGSMPYIFIPLFNFLK